jgi:hypothetical protein
MIARVFGSSLMMPIIPMIRATGTNGITSSPPRVASGLRQPGMKITMQTIVTPAMARRTADVFP